MVSKEWTTGANIDKLVSVDMRVRGHHTPELNLELYECARKAEGDPISYASAQSLQRDVDAGDTVIVATGAGGPPWLPRGETDGPQGAVALARTCALALGAIPVLTTEERSIPPLVAAARSAGLNVLEYEQLQERREAVETHQEAVIKRERDSDDFDEDLIKATTYDPAAAVAIVPYPEDKSESESTAQRMMQKYDPTAIMAVEKLGPNREGVIHSSKGGDQTATHADMGPLFDLADENDVLTIGCGDRGNEIGCAKIEEDIRELHPYGAKCPDDICGCGGGMATRIATDHLFIGGTSNWAAYGIAAMLAALTRQPDALHSPEEEVRMLEQSVLEGSTEGGVARPVMKVDFTSKETQFGMLTMLNDIVQNSLTEIHRPF